MVTTLLPANVDYTDKDFVALKLRLQGLIRSVFPQWTNFNKAGFDNILLESFCFVGDVCTYSQDRQARDCFWPTVTERSNAIRLGRMTNYQMATAQPAVGTVRFSMVTNPGTAKSIPYGTKVRTSGTGSSPVYFRTTETGKEIPTTGNPWVDVTVEQTIAVGYRDPLTDTLTPGETFVSTGAANQRYITVQSPVILYNDSSIISISVEAEEIYYRVSSFLDTDPVTGGAIGPTSRVFVAVSTADGNMMLIFGNRISGRIPEGTVNIAYKIGGGSIGNMDAGEITLIDSVDSSLYGVNVTNPAATSGGTERTTVLQARSLGPKSLRTLERCVTKEDFEIKAEEISGVARAVMVTSNEDATIQENAGTLLVVAQGEKLDSGRIAPATPSSAMLAQVETNITTNNPPTLTFSVSVAAAPFLTINVATRVYLASGSVSATVAQAIRDALDDFFAVQLDDGTDNTAIDFGADIKQADGTIISEIAWSDIFNAINDTTGVRKVDEGPQGLLLNSLRQSISLNVRQFPVIGSVTIYDIDAGAGI